MGIKISEHFGGAYLSGPDVPLGQSFRLQVGDTRIESFDDGGTKVVLSFLNARKGLPLNKTNASALSAVWGDDTEDWYGRWLELFSVPTTYNGRNYNGLRVRPIEPPPSYRQTPDAAPAEAAPTAQQPAAAPVGGVPASQTRAAMLHEAGTDEIPF
jgi:hypothetical protein